MNENFVQYKLRLRINCEYDVRTTNILIVKWNPCNWRVRPKFMCDKSSTAAEWIESIAQTQTREEKQKSNVK